MGATVKYGVDSEERSSRAAQGHGDQEEAAGQEGNVGQTKAGKQRGEYSLGLPDMRCNQY